MRLVLDASIVLPLVASSKPEADRLRTWTEQMLDEDDAHIIGTLTPLEVMSALNQLEANFEIETEWATEVQRRSLGWPFARENMTQPRLERAWELRTRFTLYDAAYLATAESLQSEHKEDVALLTADPKLKNAPAATLPCQILTFPG